MSDVFISYAREDHTWAQSLAEALSNSGLTVFWDRKISAGSTFEDVIEKEISVARAVVVLWSKHSVRSDWVRAEASEGASRGILVPATLDGERPPLRYRIAHTANLVGWSPGNPTAALSAFLQDVAKTVRACGPEGSHVDESTNEGARKLVATSSDDRTPTRSTIRVFLKASIVFAWTGSIALALTIAYDYRLVYQPSGLHDIAYWVTLFSLALGGISAAALGGLSLKRQFVIGVLQGWVWPIVGAVFQLLILKGSTHLIGSLPFASELEVLIAFALFGAIIPGLLTTSAVLTSRSLDRVQ